MAIVVVQNIVRGATTPQNDADIGEIIPHFTDDTAAIRLLAVTFVLSGVALAAFVGGLWSRVSQGTARPWATAGMIGAVAVAALFSVAMAIEVSLTVLAGQVGSEVMLALWTLHNAVFAVNMVLVAIALLGLGMASAITGLVGPWMRWVATIGALLMAAAASQSIALTEGSAIFAVGIIGFIGWMVFVAAAGLAVVRSSRSGPSAS